LYVGRSKGIPYTFRSNIVPLLYTASFEGERTHLITQYYYNQMNTWVMLYCNFKRPSHNSNFKHGVWLNAFTIFVWIPNIILIGYFWLLFLTTNLIRGKNSLKWFNSEFVALPHKVINFILGTCAFYLSFIYTNELTSIVTVTPEQKPF